MKLPSTAFRRDPAWRTPAALAAVFLVAGLPFPLPLAASQSPSTAKMARLLAEMADRTDPRASPFLNAERLKLIRAVPAPEQNPGQMAMYLFMLGSESVLAGDSIDAVEAFERLGERIANGEARLDPASLKAFSQMRGLSHLRLGEQENCVESHNIDRCLLPIRGSGVHSKERGSRGAVEVYAQLLAKEPENLEYRWT